LVAINDADPNDIVFTKAVNPALVISGTAVFNDPVSIQGGLFGASPIDVYAPLRYKAASAADDLLIQRGKFIGRVEISSSNAEHGLFLEGAARIKATTTQAEASDLKPEIQFINDVIDQSTYPVIDLRKYNNISVAQHPQIDGYGSKMRRHDQYTIGDIHFATKLPILTGSDSSNLDNYELTDFRISRITTTVDARRNAYQLNFLTAHTEFDPEYEEVFAVSGSGVGSSVRNVSSSLSNSFSSSQHNTDPNSTVNTLIVGSFANPGQGNRYGLKRGIMVGGNIMPLGANLSSFGSGDNHSTYDGTIGHPAARWGDMYVHDNRYIRWGQQASSGNYRDFFQTNLSSAANRNEENTVLLGFSTSSNMLEIIGSPLLADAGLNVTGSGYVNFGLTTGSTGYGIRDNDGILEFRNTGTGSWTQFGTGTEVSTIGTAEDGTYADGLFTDFTTSTPVGTPVDRFNEVLKILAPSPAPSVDRINYEQSAGETAKLSFDASNTITSYNNSSTNAGFDTIARNGTYQSETSGSNFRLGVYNAQNLSGLINFTTAENSTGGYVSYASGAFGNAERGSLKLELNGAVIHTADLSSFTGTGNPATGSANSLTNGSGFTNVSTIASSYDGNGAEWYIFKHRTAKFLIEADEQATGWNYLRIVHTIDAVDYTTNYIEWINDTVGASQALSVSNERIEDIVTSGSIHLSGVEYNTAITANYKVGINNIYRNVFPTGTPISFSSTRATSPSAQAVPSLGIGEDETKLLEITASFDLLGTISPSQTIGLGVNATHPLKSNLSNAGSATATGFLVFDNTPPVSSNIAETFINEDRRVTSGSYDTISSVIAAGATWDSETSIESGEAATSGYDDGLLQLGTSEYNGRLYSPISTALPNSGDFASLANGASNPNYSGESGQKTYFRKIENTQVGDLYSLKVSTTKGSTLFNNSSLGTGNVNVYIKIPSVTGWMDISQNFSYGNIADGQGALISTAGNDTDSNNNIHHITFGTASVSNGDYLVLKIVADSTWAGYLSQLDFQLGASSETPTQAPALDDIDANNSGINAKLSFGSSNGVVNYSNATGSVISLTDFNSNSDYTLSGDRRGIFSSMPTLVGTLNEDVSSNGNNYPADSFFNGYSGSLVLEINGTEVRTIDLNSTLSSISSGFSGNDSGFSVSPVSFSTTSDNIPSYIKPYRTGSFQVGSNNQNLGWNYARVIHRTSGDTTTNYVEWIVDTSGSTDNTAVSTPVLSNFNHSAIYYQSGIGYFASNPTASFDYTGSNFYTNVYHNSSAAVSFPTTTNCAVINTRIIGTGVTTVDSAVSSLSLPALDNSADCELTSIEVTGTVQYNGSTPSISGGLGLFTDNDISVTGRLLHPFKTDRTTSTASKASFMVYSGSIGSTNLNTEEYLNTEDYRIVSGNYANQAAVIASGNSWNPQRSINDTGTYPEHADGLVTVNGFAISPLLIGNAGDTRNAADGGSLQAPAGNPNYSTLSNDVRTVYRYFRNETGLSKATFTVSLYGDATIVAKSGAFYTGTLGANKNINVEIKTPYDPSFDGLDDTSTAWGDVVKPYSAGVQPTSDGVGIYSGGGSGLDQTVDSDGTSVGIQLQQSQVRDDQYFIVKISAHKNWTGYLSRIQITY
jgi:hypothetical protein